MEALDREDVINGVRAALAEDLGSGDATSQAVIPEGTEWRADMVARMALVVAGLEVAKAVFLEVSPQLRVTLNRHDGQKAESGTVLIAVEGPARAILSAERVALNFVQRLSGIATLTAKFVEAVRGTNAKILDTRKTTPGLRVLEKYAVTCGGGQNHRIGLFDMILIKDNHLAALAGEKPKPIAAAVQRARVKFPKLKVEVEAETLEQVQQALDAGADIILLDNMTPVQLRVAVKLVGERAKTEASGGITLDTVRSIAETGVDFISVGALTHSAPAADIALDFVRE
jgi:nicotinate-nucleotide pyrophosphorylase (carboxylating)